MLPYCSSFIWKKIQTADDKSLETNQAGNRTGLQPISCRFYRFMHQAPDRYLHLNTGFVQDLKCKVSSIRGFLYAEICIPYLRNHFTPILTSQVSVNKQVAGVLHFYLTTEDKRSSISDPCSVSINYFPLALELHQDPIKDFSAYFRSSL